MKTTSLLVSSFCLAQLSLQAQVPAVSAPATVVEVAVQPQPPVILRTLNPTMVQRQLSTAPRIVVATPAPPAAVKTTRTTTVVDTPGQPQRVYNSETSVVLVAEQGQTRKLPFVTLPLLFLKETANLLDEESRAALQQVAGIIMAVGKTEPGAVYDIEGHTSTDGTEEFNRDLSAARAQRVYDVLTQTYGVSPDSLSAHGYGESFPMYPQGSEAEMQQDRRVLVVRTK